MFFFTILFWHKLFFNDYNFWNLCDKNCHKWYRILTCPEIWHLFAIYIMMIEPSFIHLNRVFPICI